MLLLAAPALAFDQGHALLQTVLSARSSGGKVDYAGLRANPADLDTYLRELATAPVASMSASEKKAFWINAYNALTLDLVADNYPLKSILDLDGGKVWDTRKFSVGGSSMTLNDIENKQLRTLGDPRIHAAINCASKGCPPLSSKVFLASTLESQLDAQARAWAALQPLSGGTLTVSSIFDWFGEDFTKLYGPAYRDLPGLEGEQEAAVNFVARYDSARAASLTGGGIQVVYGDYSWALNAR